ncbi:MAG: rod shape-determining protein MreC [Anaerolineae bacterium]|nr:rod shape-determining protein MreC [Anaerolineae bacterium]
MRKRDLFPILLLATAVALLVSDQIEGVNAVSSWVADLSSRGQSAVSSLVRNVGNARVFFQDLEQLRQENELLKRRAEELTVQLVALQEVVAENELLRTELGFVRSQRSLRVMGANVEARVAGREPGNLIRALLISTGADGGLLPDMPVITGRGLVGRVVEVAGHSAQVLLINDARSAVAALVQRTRASGIVKGQLDGSIVMEGIDCDADVQVGDVVLTSGLGDVFPKGIVIGQVSEVIRSDTAMFQKAVISPSVDLSDLEVVVVILEHEPGVPVETAGD